MRIAPVFWIPVLLLAGLGCGGGKYGDAKKVVREFTAAQAQFNTSMGKAASAKDVANALDTLAARYETLMPEMQKMQQKYPELASATPPQELVEDHKLMREEAMKMGQMMMKGMMQYANDPDVKKASDRLTKAMTLGTK